MRIVICSDVPNWAIGHLAQSVEKFNDRHQIKMMYVHPRDAGEKSTQENFLREIKDFNPDIIDFEYFRTAGQLVEAIPEKNINYRCLKKPIPRSGCMSRVSTINFDKIVTGKLCPGDCVTIG